MAVSAGFLMGGGSLLGADVEYTLPYSRWGVQAGAGLVGFGAGVSYHLKPSANSSFISVQYWNTWIAGSTISLVAPMFAFRYKYFQAGAGCGVTLPTGYFAERKGMLLPLLSIGAYVPFSSGLFAASPSAEKSPSPQKNKAVSVGISMGGGSLLGADVEYLLPGSRWGLQAGAGLSSVSAGVTCHLKPHIGSSFASVQYWHWQIWQPRSAVAVVGPLFAYRAPKYFQVGLGFSYALYQGVDVYASERIKYYWLFNIGAYFPW
jgi:hypothetical protein